jgi:hypothetical protein
MEEGTAVRTSGWELEAFADKSAAFVFTRTPIGVMVLDRLSWLVLELCDGRANDAIVSRVASILGADRAPMAKRVVEGRLAQLSARGLVRLAPAG